MVLSADSTQINTTWEKNILWGEQKCHSKRVSQNIVNNDDDCESFHQMCVPLAKAIYVYFLKGSTVRTLSIMMMVMMIFIRW